MIKTQLYNDARSNTKSQNTISMFSSKKDK